MQRVTAPVKRDVGTAVPGILQRKCACGNHAPAGGRCAQCAQHDSKVERSAPHAAYDVGHGAGRPLEPAAQTFFQQRFGRDFSHVRVHTDGAAGDAARGVAARAYTLGSHIVFAPGQYQPTTPAGRHLLAHELTHVVQQGGAVAPAAKARTGAVDSPAEREADHVAQCVVTGAALPAICQRPGPALLQRQSANPAAAPGSSQPQQSCGPDVTDWFFGIMTSAQTDPLVLGIQSRLSGAARVGARYGYSASDVLEGGLVRKLVAAERAAGSPTRTADASSQIAAADPSNQFGRALMAATIPIAGAPEQLMLAAIRGASLTWKSLVETGAVWDFKNNVLSGSRLAAAGCASPCAVPPTLSLCGACYEHDLPGNIFYAYIGRICGFSRNALQLGSQFAELLPSSSGGWDPPEDTAAINLGFGLPTALTRSGLCSAITGAGTALTTRACSTCPVTYSP